MIGCFRHAVAFQGGLVLVEYDATHVTHHFLKGSKQHAQPGFWSTKPSSWEELSEVEAVNFLRDIREQHTPQSWQRLADLYLDVWFSGALAIATCKEDV